MQDRMFHVLVLGGLALVGCGGSVGTESEGNTPPDDARASGARSSSISSSDSGSGLSLEGGVVVDGPVVTTDGGSTDASVEDAAALPPSSAAQDAGGIDAHGYADATIINPGCRLPCEAPPPM
jgi:hypothetical protein